MIDKIGKRSSADGAVITKREIDMNTTRILVVRSLSIAFRQVKTLNLVGLVWQRARFLA